MAIKSQSGGGSTSRDYRKGLKSALKANKYKPTSQEKGQYKKISGQLAKKAKSGDKYSAGAGAAFSMLRQEKAMSNRGGGGTTSAVAKPKATKKVAKKIANKALVGVIKANQFKPTANKIKNSNYSVLDSKLKQQSAIAGYRGDKGAKAAAEGARRGISVMRQDAAAARRGTVDRTGPNKKVTPKPTPAKKKTKSKSPITSIGGYKSNKVLFNGAKKPKSAFTFPEGPKTTFTGTTVASGSGVTKLNNAAKKMVAAQTAKRKAAAAAAAKKKATSKKKTTTGTAPSGTISIGGISLKK